MSATAVTPTAFPGFLIPEATLEVWEAECTAGQSGPVAGPVEAQPDGNGIPPKLVLGAVGEQTAGTTLEVLTQQGGHLGVAGGVWKESADTLYRGKNLPNVNEGFQKTAWTGTNTHRCPHPIVTADGTELVFMASKISPLTTWAVWVRILNATADTYSAVSVAPLLNGTYTPHPAGLPLADGRVLCAFWLINSAVTYAQIAVRQSRDNGATWSTVTIRGLPTAFSLSTGTTYTPRRLAWGVVGGAIVLFAHVTSSTSHEYIYQYASDDDGATFSEIGSMQNVGFPEVVFTAERCVLGYVQMAGTSVDTVAYMARVLSPYSPVTTGGATAIVVGHLKGLAASAGATSTWNAITGDVLDGDLAMARWGEKTVAVFGLIRTLGVQVGKVALVDMDTLEATAIDDTAAVDSESWWATPAGADYPSEFRAVQWRGRVHMHSLWWSGASDLDYQVGRLALGGWTTNTMQIDETSSALEDAHGWHRTQTPTDTMAAFGWTYTGAGTVSTTTDPGWEQMITAAAAGYYTIAVTTANTGELVVRAQLKLNSGGGVTARGVMLGIRFGYAGHGSEIEVRCSTTQARVRDPLYGGGAGLDIATISVDFANGGEIEIAMSHLLATARARSLGGNEDRVWTPIVTGQAFEDDLGAGGTTKTITLGARAAVTADQSWRVVGYSAFAGTMLSAGLTNPTDLRPGEYTAEPIWFGKGVSVSAHDGPAAQGDEYEIPADADFPYRHLLPRGSASSAYTVQGGQVTSPRTGWRGTATSGRVAFRYEVQDEVAAPYLLGVHVEGANSGSWALQGYYSGSWHTLATVDQTASFPFTLKGDRVRVNTGGSFSTTPYFRDMEAVGGYLKLDDGAVNIKVRPIRANRKGRASNAGTDPLPTFDLDHINGLEPTSGTATLYYPRSTIILAMSGTEVYEGFALYWSSAPRMYEDELRVGKVIIGPVVVPGISHGLQWARTRTSGAQINESEAGVRFGRQEQPVRRAVALPFSTETPQRWATDSDVGAYYSAKTSGPIVARRGDDAMTVDGMLVELDGSRIPVVYVPRIEFGASTTLLGDLAGLYGRLVTQEVRWEAIAGTEQYPVWRGDVLAIEEET